MRFTKIRGQVCVEQRNVASRLWGSRYCLITANLSFWKECSEGGELKIKNQSPYQVCDEKCIHGAGTRRKI